MVKKLAEALCALSVIMKTYPQYYYSVPYRDSVIAYIIGSLELLHIRGG